MPAKRELTMRQIRQMLRLHHDGVSAREIGRALGVARSTIQDNLKRAEKAGQSDTSFQRYYPCYLRHRKPPPGPRGRMGCSPLRMG
jgi:IS30 family transposase